MTDGRILDEQITASSQRGTSSAASQVRIDTPDVWAASSPDYEPWLKVDFQDFVEITIIKTMGGAGKFVRTFSVSFGSDDTNFQQYQDNGRTKVLSDFYQDA